MKRVGLIFSIISLLFIPAFVFAFEGWTYERSPAGTSILSPVSYHITTDDIINFDEDIASGCLIETGCKYWIKTCYTELFDECIYSEKVLIDLDHIFVVDLPIYDYYSVELWTGDCNPETPCSSGVLEPPQEGSWEVPEIVFTITGEAAAVGEIVPVDNSFVLGALSYAGIVWDDFSMIALFGMGLPLGFWIVKKVITIF